MSVKPRDLKGPDDLRPVKMPRRIVARLDAKKKKPFEPRWSVVEDLLNHECESDLDDTDTTSREERT